MTTFAIISLILGIVEPVLASSGVIPTSYQPLAQGILNAINAIKGDLTNSATGQVSITAITLLQAISSGLQTLQTVGALPAGLAGLVTALDNSVQAGITSYEQSQLKVDPAALQPIAPVV